MADRYAYLPFIGIYLMVVWGLAEFGEQQRYAKLWVFVSAFLVLVAMSALTYHQIGYWRDSKTLWSYTLRVTKRNYMAEDNLAIAFAKLGNVTEAIPHFQAAEGFHDYPLSEILNLGLYEQHNGYFQEAIGQYERILNRSSDPQMRGIAYGKLGTIYTQLGNRDVARKNYESALQLNPNNAFAHVGVALLAQHDGDLKLAVSQLSQAMSVEPTDVGFLLLANVLSRTGHIAEAEAANDQAIRISKDLAEAQRTADHLLAQ
jgi:tetratricopeptide (TPR) repeat protein